MSKTTVTLIATLIAYVAVCFVAIRDAEAGDRWTDTNTALELGYLAVAFVDMRTTMDIRNHPDIIEVGPARHFLGKNPEPLPTVAYFAAGAAAHYAISRALPRGWRETWQVVSIGFEGGYAVHNVRMGLKWGF